MTAAAHLVPHHASAIPQAVMLPSVLVGGILLAYLIGSIPFGLILGKFFKIGDLREQGSGNIGATNMLRVGGKNLAIATLVLDMLKGFVAVMLCGGIAESLVKNKFATEGGIRLDVTLFYYYFGLYAVIGHVWPIWLRGKGGKGVATALGAVLGFSPVAGLLVMACWLTVFALTLYSSLSAIVSIALAPVICYFVSGKPAAIVSFLIALIVIYRHKDNIKRLLSGTESKSDLRKRA